MALQTYDPSEVTLYIAILYEVEGFSPDTLISLSKDTGYYSTSKGATGGVERTHIADKTYTLEVSLSQTSPSNSVLNTFATLDNVSGRGIFPIFAKDSSGQSIFLAGSCWIESPPSASYTSGIETRVWTIKCSDVVFGLAGNETDQSIISQVGNLANLVGQFGGNTGLI